MKLKHKQNAISMIRSMEFFFDENIMVILDLEREFISKVADPVVIRLQHFDHKLVANLRGKTSLFQ